MSAEPEAVGGRWTRAELLRRAAGAGVGVGLASRGLGGRGLLGAGVPAAAAATVAPTVHQFHSRPDLVPPAVTVSHRAAGIAAGSIFLAPSSGPGQRGTLIADDSGEPIWFQPTTPVTAMNFRAATYKGAPVLTWWEGKTEQGLGEGTHVVADASYRTILRFPAGDGLASDLHELLLTPRGTALVTAWEKVDADLPPLGGSAHGTVVGGVVQELELPSGKVLFEWHSVDHVPFDESHTAVGNPFDYFHINAIATTEDGNLLVSSRNTWTVYKLDRGSGEIIWRLGGKRSDFTMGPDTLFAWQHDARAHGTPAAPMISLFDDGAAPKVQPQSRGMVLALDTKRMRATLVRAFPHTPPVLATALGSTQLQPNGNWLVGYGTAPYLSEYTADGKVVWDAHLPAKAENYRALRFPWTGHPTGRPALAHSTTGDTNVLYVSWNGATEVHTWQIESGTRPDSLTSSEHVAKAGFETVMPTPSGAAYAAAVALDAAGKPLGKSATLKL